MDNTVEYTSHSNIDRDSPYQADYSPQQFHFLPVLGLEGVYNVSVQRSTEMQDLIVVLNDGRRQVFCNTDYLPDILRVTFE